MEVAPTSCDKLGMSFFFPYKNSLQLSEDLVYHHNYNFDYVKDLANDVIFFCFDCMKSICFWPLFYYAVLLPFYVLASVITMFLGGFKQVMQLRVL